jgi:hypothetical protein
VASTRFFWAEGSPCRNPYLDQGALVRALASAHSAEAAGT